MLIPTLYWIVVGSLWLAVILVVIHLCKTRHLPEQDEAEHTEFDATFDALHHDRDEAAKIKARAIAHERAQLAADAAVMAKYGPQHAPVEL